MGSSESSQLFSCFKGDDEEDETIRKRIPANKKKRVKVPAVVPILHLESNKLYARRVSTSRKNTDEGRPTEELE